MTQMATITVKYRNAAKLGASGKMGPASVKDSNGTIWKFWSDKVDLDSFQEGKSYTVGYSKKPGRNGEENFIENVIPADNVTPIPITRPATNGNGNGKYTPTDDKTAERIFVCGAINHAIGAGKVDVFAPDEIVNAVEALRSAYVATFGKQ